MKYLKGNKQRYFSLSIIVLYSTMFKIYTIHNNYKYHKFSFEYQEYKTSPPFFIFYKKLK